MIRAFLTEGDAYELLAEAAGEVWGWDALPKMEREEGGKPFFPDYPECYFNLSHSGDLALCVLGDAPVGADLEILRPREADLPARLFQGAYWTRFQEMGGDWSAFYALWTELESIIKYTGQGISAWRDTELPRECVLSNVDGMGWQGTVCAREALQEDPEYVYLVKKEHEQ